MVGGPLDTRMAVLAAELILPGLPLNPDGAVALALDLLAAGKVTPSTAEVAGVPSGSTLRDTEPAIRAMLLEQGIDLPDLPDTEDGQYSLALWAFGHGGLGVGEFGQWFYPQCPAWDDQGKVDRALVVLLVSWERETDPSARARLEDEMRAAARS